MAKRVKQETKTCLAHRALVAYHEGKHFVGCLNKVLTTCKGKIQQVVWTPNRAGLSEATYVVFEDESVLTLTKFIRGDGRCTINLKVTSLVT